MNGWRALQEILVLALVHTGSCKTRTIGKEGQKLKCKGGKANILKENKCSGTGTARTLVWWLLAENATKLKSDRETFTFTWTGPQALRGAFLTMGNSTGTPVALLDCKRKGHSHRHTSKAFKAFRYSVHTVHSGSFEKLKYTQYTITVMYLLENKSDLSEIFTQKDSAVNVHTGDLEIFTFTWNYSESLKQFTYKQNNQ